LHCVFPMIRRELPNLVLFVRCSQADKRETIQKQDLTYQQIFRILGEEIYNSVIVILKCAMDI